MYIAQNSQVESEVFVGEETQPEYSSDAQPGQPKSLADQISSTVATEIEDEPTPEMEATACSGYSAPGLFHIKSWHVEMD